MIVTCYAYGPGEEPEDGNGWDLGLSIGQWIGLVLVIAGIYVTVKKPKS